MGNPKPLNVKILLLRKGIKPLDLMREFGVGKAAISMALSGQRLSLLRRIHDFAKSSDRKAA